jgi:hypothetical protein
MTNDASKPEDDIRYVIKYFNNEIGFVAAPADWVGAKSLPQIKNFLIRYYESEAVRIGVLSDEELRREYELRADRV